MSKAKQFKGKSLELKKSIQIHGESIPILICPTMLRRIGCGQVDICGIYKLNSEFVIKIFEVKSAGVVTRAQHQRLYQSANFVSQFFNLSCIVSLI